jgi:NDP-sugar pyrophosphorylase family protein
MNDLTLLVLAAGLGSRYGSLKQMDQFGPSGESIIDYSVYDAIRAGFTKVVFVIRRSMEEQFKEVFSDRFAGRIRVEYVFQELDSLPEGFQIPSGREKPWGTGHAVWVAADRIKEPFAVINADDFYGAESFQRIADFLRKAEAKSYCLVGYQLDKTLSDHGYVSRGICEVDDDQHLRSVTERTHIERSSDQQIVYRTEKGKEVPLPGDTTVSMNLMGFSADVFSVFRSCLIEFLKEYGNEPKKEFFLPSVVNEIISSGLAPVKVVHTPESWFGVTYPEDKAVAQHSLQTLVEKNVYPSNLWKN